jgi:F-type H+-transporting ATPase subunit b
MLDISPLLLLTTAVVFLVLLVVLNKVLYKPLLDFIDSRDAAIKRDMNSAGQNSSDVSALELEALDILKDAKHKAAKIREQAVSEAKDKAATLVEAKKLELDSHYAEFLKELDAEKQELKDGLYASLPSFKDGVKAKLGQI